LGLLGELGVKKAEFLRGGGRKGGREGGREGWEG